MRGFAAAVAALGLTFGVAAQAAPSGQGTRPYARLPLEGATNPDWVKLPNGDDFAQYYPRIAGALGIGGVVRMSCHVAASGALYDCKVSHEAPEGMGFGDAALAMSKLFQMKPRMVAGAPVGGAEIVVPIRFMPPPRPDYSEGAAPDTAAAPSPKALALARRIVAATIDEQTKEAILAAIGKAISGQFASGNLSEQQQAALDAMTASVNDAFPAVLDAISEEYATKFTGAELADIDTFFQSPSGRAWVAKSGGSLLTQGTAERLEIAVLADARKRFCAKYACVDAAPTPTAAK